MTAAPKAGLLIVNADDLGGNRLATDRILTAFRTQAVTSATAMMFMADTGRAASLASDLRLPTGLHLNLTQDYDGAGVPAAIAARQRRVTAFLAAPRSRRTRFSPVMVRHIRAVVTDQLHAYRDLFGVEPSHLDGHNHAHLNPTAILALPSGTRVRPAFRDPNRRGPRRVPLALRDQIVAAGHVVPDHFFALDGIHPELGGTGLDRALRLARSSSVEIMVHPDRDATQAILGSDAWAAALAGHRLGTYADLPARR